MNSIRSAQSATAYFAESAGKYFPLNISFKQSDWFRGYRTCVRVM